MGVKPHPLRDYFGTRWLHGDDWLPLRSVSLDIDPIRRPAISAPSHTGGRLAQLVAHPFDIERFGGSNVCLLHVWPQKLPDRTRPQSGLQTGQAERCSCRRSYKLVVMRKGVFDRQPRCLSPDSRQRGFGLAAGGLVRITIQGRDAFPFYLCGSGRWRAVGHLCLPNVA
jgi:hypothetical protein